MSKTVSAALVAVSLLSLAACQKQASTTGDASAAPSAASAGVDGTWKADLATVQIDAKPDQVLLKDGKYACATCTPPLTLEVTIIGDRPSGETDASLSLVVAAMEATQLIGREADLATASTDANVPISRGIPAIAIGAGGRGGEAHTLGEWFENAAGHLGVVRALAIVVAVAGLAV